MLGPLLFLIYINDLPDCLVPPVQAKIFADDTKLYATHSSDSSSPLSLSLSNFCMWTETWQLNIAFQKCSVISFGHNSASNSYSLGGVLLNRVFDICDLGVHIAPDFKPSLHCASIAAKAFQRCSNAKYLNAMSSIHFICQTNSRIHYSSVESVAHRRH